jgi:hypothetical protein
MQNPEKIFYPLTVVAAIVGIWYFFSKSGNSVGAQNTVTSAGPSGLEGQLAPIGQVLAQPLQAPPGIQYIINAAKDPQSTNPGAPDPQTGPPNYLTYNLGPNLVLSKSLDLAASQELDRVQKAAKKGGCGGSCGGCSKSTTCISPCNETNSRFTDGRGACMVTQPDVPKTWIDKAVANFYSFDTGYANIVPSN